MKKVLFIIVVIAIFILLNVVSNKYQNNLKKFENSVSIEQMNCEKNGYHYYNNECHYNNF